MTGASSAVQSLLCRRRGGICLLAALLLLPLLGTAGEHDIRPGPGVSEVLSLSDYHGELTDTPGDTPVYLLEGDQQGETVLLLGGSHPNEIASVMAAVLIVEQARVDVGRFFVIPYANNAAAWITEANENATPRTLEFVNPDGEKRAFAYGTRVTAAELQEPTEDAFVHYPSGRELPGREARNLNRVHPGKADGTLTQQISYALFELVRGENVGIVVDMHEAPPGALLANMIISHPRGMEIAVSAVMNLELHGINLDVDVPRQEAVGLSHREFGDRTDVLAFLIESPNPGQLPGGDPVDDPENPLTHRVRLQLYAIHELLQAHARGPYNVAASLTYSFELDDLLTGHLGEFLR